MIAHSILETIGHTPLVELSPRTNPTHARILVKIEAFNPGGSAKDRVALSMIRAAEASGSLQPGATIIEPTSGNTGVGLALVAAVQGYHLILTMPETMSIERRKLAAAYGAQIVLTPGSAGMSGAIAEAERLHASIPGSLILQQFENPANPAAHEASTGPEIWADTHGHLDAFVATVGTGGTLSGTGHYLRAQHPSLHIVAVEPEASPLLSKGHAGPHKLQGIGANFVPATLDTSLYNEILTVTPEQAGAAAHALAAHEGILAGITSGAALAATLTLAARPEWANKTIVTLLPDTGERYLSTWLWDIP